jgi:hypothetical protein
MNKQKHGISFEEASEIFINFPLEIFFDPESAEDEDRYLGFGFSNRGKSLLVVHCENTKGTEIRIISARKATKKEMKSIFGD